MNAPRRALTGLLLIAACQNSTESNRGGRAIVASLANNVCIWQVHWALFDSDSRPWSDTSHVRLLKPGESDTIWARAGNPPVLTLRGTMTTTNPDPAVFTPGYYPVDDIDYDVFVNDTAPYAVVFPDQWRCAS